MELSERWLREWVDPPIDSAQLVAQLTMAGLEVDSLVPVAIPFTQVVVGEVETLEPHPNADRLKVCQVNIGQSARLQIVCGATNVQVGMRVPTALVGAKLPSGTVIKAAQLRGVASSGMLCSALELGLASTADGLLALAQEAPLGMDVFEYLQLNDRIIKVDLTPNRGDCLSIVGMAREVAALNRLPLKVLPPVEIEPSQPDLVFPVTVEASSACPRYCGRVMTQINPHAETPAWLQEKLRRSGLRSISPVVDVTNFVLLEYGQPLHAFDLASLDREICVRFAQAGETLTLLNGNAINFAANSTTTAPLVIADATKVIALAGIMGGAETAVAENTTALFLESAFFDPVALAGKARHYGLATDSSYRFERGVDFSLPRIALERATQLLLAIVGGSVGPVIEVVQPSHLPERKPIYLRANRVSQLLGLSLAAADIIAILQHLGMTLTPAEAGWWVVAPSHRFDINLEVDLIEEIMRIHGYNQLPSHHPRVALGVRSYPTAYQTASTLKQTLVAQGYQEVITYSFIDPKLQSWFDPERAPLALANPIAPDMAVMRTQLWPGLVQTLSYNQKRQQKRIRLFEQGLNFIQQAEQGLVQQEFLAGVAVGEICPEQWGMPLSLADFFSVKADVMGLLGRAGGTFVKAIHPALHPGKTAKIERNGQWVGWLGVLHPALAQKLDIVGEVVLFELALAGLAQPELPKFTALSKFPSVRRDLAVVVAEDIPAQTVIECIADAGVKALHKVQLFDRYQGAGIASTHKSLAFSLNFQDHERTFEDTDIDQFVAIILQRLNTKLNAQLRG